MEKFCGELIMWIMKNVIVISLWCHLIANFKVTP